MLLFSTSRYRFFLFILFCVFFLCPQQAVCSGPVMIFQAADAAAGQNDEVLEDNDPWAEQGDDAGSLSGEETWEDEWKDSDENAGKTEDVWGEESDQESDKDESPLKLSGKFRNKFAHDVNQDNTAEDDMMNHAQLKVGASLVHGDRLQAVLYMDADYFSYGNHGDWEEDGDVRLDDAYINFRGDGFNLKLGNQVVRWGKTDAYSPLDNLNPEDLRGDLSGRREDRKLPTPMANLEIYTGNMTVSGVFIPFFIKPEYDLTGTDWSVFGHVNGMRLTEDDPSDSLKNSEGGIRLSGIAGSLDWAVSWLHAREDLPAPDSLVVPVGFPLPAGNLTTSQLADFLNATSQTLVLKHDRQNIFGIEFETTLSSFGVRGDLAYIDNTSYFTRDLQRVRKPVVQVMTGIDYVGVSDWYVNLQFLVSHVRDYENRIVWAKENTRAVNGTVWKEFFNGDLRAECRYYYDLSGDATVLNPKFRLSFWKPVIIEIGGEWFGGTDETIPGRFRDNDQIYTAVEIKF